MVALQFCRTEVVSFAMLEDRDYMRAPDFREHRISVTVAILIVNALVVVAHLIASNSLTDVNLQHAVQGIYFALSLNGLKHFYIWQLLTFQFMHAGWWHLLGNSLAIFFFCRPVEEALGAKQCLKLYFLSGIAGGVLQMIFALFLPEIFCGGVVGASAGAFGLMGAFALMNWRQQFTVFVYFVFPALVTGKILFWVCTAVSIIGFFFPSSGIANAAHLGGIIAGALYVRLLLQPNRFSTYDEPRELAPARASKKFWQSSSQSPSADNLSAEEFLQREVDPILEKISAQGIQSLTKREREVLEKARSKMDKR